MKRLHDFTSRPGGVIARALLFCAVAAVLIYPAPPARGELVDRVVAVVGGDVVTLMELQQIMAQYPGVDGEKALEILIEDLLVEQEARRQGIVVSEAEVDAAVKARIAQLNVSEEEFQSYLAQQGMTMEQFRDNMRGKLMKLKYVRQAVRGTIEVTEEEMLNYYRLHQDQFMKGEEVHLGHILLPFSWISDPEEMEKARKLARELYQRIQAGEDFADIAKEYSRGGGNDQGGGDIGWVKIEEMMPEFASAVEGLSQGEVAPPIETSRGMHILKIIDRRQSEAVPFEEVKERIYERLYDQKIQEELYKLVQEIKDRTPIERRL